MRKISIMLVSYVDMSLTVHYSLLISFRLDLALLKLEVLLRDNTHVVANLNSVSQAKFRAFRGQVRR